MKTMSAREAKNGFGILIDTALVEPVTVEKHGRPVVVVLSIEKFEKMKAVAHKVDGLQQIGSVDATEIE